MKEFKAWDEKNYPLPPTIERGPIGRDALKQRETTWRAALEWTISQPLCHYSKDIIKKELNT